MKKNGEVKTKRLSTKLTLYIVFGLLIAFVVLITAITITTKNDLTKRETEKLELLATGNAAVARDFMETMISKQEVLVHAVQNSNKFEKSDKISFLSNLIDKTQQGEDNILSLFIVAEPDIVAEDTPNGYSIFATEKGVTTSADMYNNVNKELYQTAKGSKKMTIIDPFKKTIDGKEYTVVTVMMPILGREGEVTGMIGSNIDTAVLNSAAYSDGGYDSFTNLIVCGHQTVIVSSDSPEESGMKFVDVSKSENTSRILDSAQDGSTLNILDTNTDGKKYYKSYVPFYIKGSNVVWLSGTSISSEEFNAAIVGQILVVVFCSVLCFWVLAVLVFVRVRKALKPIKEIDAVARELSKGNLDVQLNFHSNDELGTLADSLRNSIKTLYGYVTDIDRAMGEMAEGNFDIQPTEEFNGTFKNIETSITKFIMGISYALSQMDLAAQQVSSGSDQVANGAQELSQGATEQASSVEELSATISELSGQVNTNALNAANANTRVTTVGNEIIQSNEQMRQMTEAMTQISNSSNAIGKVIKTIEDIAFQTNILALNAAVEAARAGAAGKGFAVVADEVRNLASKSAEAAKGTTELIQSSIAAVENGRRIAEGTAKSLELVVGGADEVAKTIEKISSESKAQALSISQVTSSIDEIASVVQTNSATAEESAASSEELNGQAMVLKNLVGRFKIKHF